MEIKRDFTKLLEKRLGQNLAFIQVVIGPRQVGKTTGLEQILNGWTGPKLMVSADSVSPPSADWIEVHWARARALGENVLLVFDEIQKIPGWSSQVKGLFDKDRKTRKLKVVLLGSASLSLQKGLNESLAGRYEVIKVPHWSLSECRDAFNWTLDDFLQFGGYPAAADLVDDISRWQGFMKDSIIEPVISKDIQGLVSISKPALFRQTFELAMHYPAQEISLQKLLGQLQDSGNATTIKHYLELFEGAFLLRCLQKFSGKALRTKSSSPKIIPATSALVHAFRKPNTAIENREWRGRVFESLIGAHLSLSTGELSYWRSGKYEVDFILELEEHVYAIEVKSGRKKSRRGLESFIKRYPHGIPIIIDQENGIRLLESKDIDSFFLHRKW